MAEIIAENEIKAACFQGVNEAVHNFVCNVQNFALELREG
jgi:hypothetical protein